MEDEIVELWHKLDDKFFQPESFINVSFLSPKQTNSIERFVKNCIIFIAVFLYSCFSYVYMKIYDYMLTYYLKETFSQQSSAGLKVLTNSTKKFFEVNFWGYNDKMIDFIDSVSKEIKVFNENLDLLQFETIKTQQKNRYFNNSMESDNLSNDFLKEILKDDFYLDLEILKTFNSITFENLQKYIPKFFRMMKIKILIQGNITKAQALNVAEILKTNFMCEGLDTEYELKGRCYELPLGTNVCRIKSLMLSDDNSHIQNFYQIGRKTIRNLNLLKLLESICEPKTFDYLRNREQLGYSVGCTFQDIEGILGLKVYVFSQEHKHLFTEVFQKMEIFMNDIARKAVHEITDEEFENFKQARIKLLLADPRSLETELRQNWNEIKENEYIFNRFELSAKVLKTLTKSDLQEFFDGFTKPENMRRLSVQVIGNPKVEGSSEENDLNRELKVEFMTEKLTEQEKHVGEDITKFQENLILHPIVRFKIE